MIATERALETPGSSTTPAGTTPRTFDAPGPGSWALDAEDCERPHSRWMSDVFPPLFTAGFREGMARYGALLDTIEMRIVHGFAYLAMRPVGAPPEAKGPPPRLLLWLLLRLHPQLRARRRRTEEVFRTRLWREDTRVFFEDVMPRCIAAFERIQAIDLEALSDEALLAHLDEVTAQLDGQVRDHFLRGTAAMMPVGDFVAHARAWTGCTAEEAVALLSGYSPWSVEAVREMDAVTEALRADAEAAALLEGGHAAATLDALCARGGVVGTATQRWLDRVGQRVVTGHDVAELRGVELPDMLVSALRAHLAQPPRETLRAATDAATARLRERVPPEHRATFDALLDDARYVHPMRDGHSTIDFWGIGLMRRSLLEAGRRLAARSRVRRADDVVDLTPAEIASMLRGGEGPTLEEIDAFVAWRTGHTMRDAPATLGPPAAPPPPPEWLPAPLARAARAMDAYLGLLWVNDATAATAEVRGTPASPGRHVGTARLVLTPGDFAKVQPGDVLVARITTPAYNVLLPMLGAVVTDRGGLLSHPAIVSREYGIPGVVGARDATTRIPDGARVEVDGATGTVRVRA